MMRVFRYKKIIAEIKILLGSSPRARELWDLLHRNCWVAPEISTCTPLIVLEIFWTHLWGEALVLVTPTELEIFWPHLLGKALVLVNPTVLEIF